MTLVLDAELLDPGPRTPQRGFFNVIALMRYRVLAVVAGEYDYAEAHIGHLAPDLDSPAFQPGARHRVQLTREFPAGVNVLGVEQTGPGGAFYCTSFELL